MMVKMPKSNYQNQPQDPGYQNQYLYKDHQFYPHRQGGFYSPHDSKALTQFNLFNYNRFLIF